MGYQVKDGNEIVKSGDFWIKFLYIILGLVTFLVADLNQVEYGLTLGIITVGVVKMIAYLFEEIKFTDYIYMGVFVILCLFVIVFYFVNRDEYLVELGYARTNRGIEVAILFILLLALFIVHIVLRAIEKIK